MASVKIENVVKHFGGTKVLNDISIDIRDGEFLTLVGPSGCGKSTLLRIVAGLENATAGVIAIDGRVVNDVPSKQRDIAMVFQNYALYPHMTVSENMSFAMQISNVPKEEIRRRVKEVAAILGLDHLLARYPRELSGGQRQRVAMGRAIVRNPLVFLFDEPLSNLDAKLRAQMRIEIKELHQRLKTTMIYVTHDQIEAMTMADRIAVMNNGVVEQIGTPLELYDRPQNRFVAEFIGSPSMNMIDGRIENGVFVSDGITFPLEGRGGHPDRPDVTLGIRPEHISLSDDGVDGLIHMIEPIGAETHILFDLGQQRMLGAFRERVATRIGTVGRFKVDLGRVHIFDRGTGHRVEIYR